MMPQQELWERLLKTDPGAIVHLDRVQVNIKGRSDIPPEVLEAARAKFKR
jgi:hypothetical protein